MLARVPIRWVAVGLLSLVPALAFAQEQAIPKAEPPKAALKNLLVFPAQFQLDGPRDEQRVGSLGEYADGRRWDLSREAVIVTSNPKIALVEQGVIRPVADGQATLTVSAAGQIKTIAVKVVKAGVDKPVEFTREIIPILTRAGCNQGACHGAQHGRGGFKLSLLGFDSLFDHAQIVQSPEGRRIVV